MIADMPRPLKGDRPMTSLERMRESRARRTASGRRIELCLPDQVVDALDALAKKRGVTRAKIVEDLAVAGLHAADDVAGIIAKPGDLNLLERAVHEVGHALAAIRYETPFETVTILPKRGTGGHILMKARTAVNPTERDIAREVFVLMAGEAAHRALFKLEDESEFAAGSASDRKEARRIVRLGLGWKDAAKIEAFIDNELQRAIKWANNWKWNHQIDRTAHELLRRSTMTRAEVKDYIAEF